MGRHAISFCDSCGKRVEKFAGRMVLFGYEKRKEQCFESQVTRRSWSVCKTCLNKLCATETIGDKIREDFEIHLDRLRGTRQRPGLLEIGHTDLPKNLREDKKRMK